MYYPLDNVLSGWIYCYSPFEQLVPAVNSNGTSHMEREVCVLQVVTPCIVYKCMNLPFEHPLVSLKHIYWMVGLLYNTITALNN